jgi:hypothetical protein
LYKRFDFSQKLPAPRRGKSFCRPEEASGVGPDICTATDHARFTPKSTNAVQNGMSALGHKQTHALQDIADEAEEARA